MPGWRRLPSEMPTGSHLAPAGVCLVGSVSLPVLPGRCGPRALPPLRARGPLNRSPACAALTCADVVSEGRVASCIHACHH